jgi:hypothetical protein
MIVRGSKTEVRTKFSKELSGQGGGTMPRQSLVFLAFLSVLVDGQRSRHGKSAKGQTFGGRAVEKSPDAETT